MLAVVGGKGGVGKTTTTLGVARALGRDGRRVVAVDADRDAPNLARMADVGPQDGPERPAEHDGEDVSAVESLAAGSAVEDVALLASDAGAALVVPGGRAPPGAYRDALTRLAAGGDRVVVDCPAGAGREVALPLRLADRALLVSTPRPAALRDTVKTAAMAEAVGTPVAGVALTRSRRVPPGIEALFEEISVTAVPPAGTPLDAAAVARAYRRVTHRFSRHKG